MKNLAIIVTTLLMTAILYCCDNNQQETQEEDEEEWASAVSTVDYSVHYDYMPSGGVKLKVRRFPYLPGVFNDRNYLHLEAAKQIGIKPLNHVTDIWTIQEPIVKVENGPYYFIDELDYSFPYLVPEAEQLLSDIGKAFVDTLNARGGGAYRLKVTSLLRTPATVKGLRRVNKNATDSSAHLYGTTFDISYSQFICDSVVVPRTQEDLKNLLGEILYNFREQGRCYVIFEQKQTCFHITTRPYNF
ncbi:MAG: hypothetical protein K2K88_04580 [Muribaculaceae bacterium]|nr:hypothetical protein [Muribaculaceae bacterium]MDE6352401.1 hypothetical protein [Muribaculaceae bacterium]MDE6642490.1 hypothetical protein [Muribaculaceae bacterium]